MSLGSGDVLHWQVTESLTGRTWPGVTKTGPGLFRAGTTSTRTGRTVLDRLDQAQWDITLRSGCLFSVLLCVWLCLVRQEFLPKQDLESANPLAPCCVLSVNVYTTSRLFSLNKTFSLPAMGSCACLTSLDGQWLVVRIIAEARVVSNDSASHPFTILFPK